MNKLIAGGLLVVSAISGGQAQAADLMTTMGPILATAADAPTLNTKCDAYVTGIERRQKELEAETGAATLNRTLVRYDEINALIKAGQGEFTLYQQVMADQARRDAGASCQVRQSGSSLGS